MRIGEVAAEAEVSTKTLRFYEAQGLLDAPARTVSNYRDYEDDTVERLGFIRTAQAAGLTLAEIREIIAVRDRDLAPCEHVLDLLHQRALQADEQIAELQALKRGLRELAERGQRLDPSDCDPKSVCNILRR